jgi:hypothetical protein
MGLMSEYIKKIKEGMNLETELMSLIKQYNDYNKERDTFLFVYASSRKSIPDISLTMDDYQIIYDMLLGNEAGNLDFYIETPGGSGEAAEEIAKFTREEFNEISFVVAGEAKSAGTILVLSGDEIIMTRNGSLGPIDAQVKIGRTVISAYDYMEWVKEKREEAETKKALNPFDATMIAQISPGELEGVNNSLTFAEVMVTEWLEKYKFKNWTITGTTKKEVTTKMRKNRAEEIAQALTNHNKWKSHGRSLKIQDLEDIGLQIQEADKDPILSSIIYKIQTVIRLMFSSTSTYKIFATENDKILKNAVDKSSSQDMQVKSAESGKIGVKCKQCGEKHEFYFKFVNDPKIDEDFKKKGILPFPKDNKLKCKCGYTMDLNGIKNEIETKTGKKMVM